MPAGVGPGALWALVRETRALEQRSGEIVVSGSGAPELATLIAFGGDRSAIRVGGDPAGAAAAVILLAAPPSAAEAELMRRATRAGLPVVAIRTGGFRGAVPYALPGDVVDVAGNDVPLGPAADTLVSALRDEDAVLLARRLPALRGRVEQRLIGRTAIANAAIAASPWMREAHLPLMTRAQGRMLLRLGAAGGGVLPHEPQQLALTAGPPLAASLAAGVGLRGLYRRLPVGGPVVAALVAYLGTRALGAAGARLPRPG